MRIVDDDWAALPDSHLLSCRTSVSGASVTCLMEGVTSTMAGLGRVPRSSQGGLYGHALDIFFGSSQVSLLEMDVADGGYRTS